MNTKLWPVIGLGAFLVSNMGYASNQPSFGEAWTAPIGVSITKIADDNPNPPPGTFIFTRFSAPAISGDEVAFPNQRQLNFTSLQIFTSLGGSISQVDELNLRFGGDFFGDLSLSDGAFAYAGTASAGPARVESQFIRFGDSNGKVTTVISVITSSAAHECQGDLSAPSVSEGVVAFREVITLASPNCNTPPAGDAIYIYNSNVSGSSPVAVVTQGDSVPGGTSKFTSFGDPSISGNLIAFVGGGSNGERGIYTNNINTMSQSVSVAADINTPIPDGNGNFVAFGKPSLYGIKVAFGGSGSNGQQGIYTGIEEAVNLVADTSTPIPGRTGTFTSFGDPVLSSKLVAFFGSDSNNGGGIYVSREGVKHNPVLKVIDTSDILDGKAITRLSFGHGGLSGNRLAFLANFSDGSSGIYKAEITTTKDQCKNGGHTKFRFKNQGQCIQFVDKHDHGDKGDK